MAGKASKKFDLGELTRALAQPVPDSGTAREQIEYIDIDLLDSDPGNFYGLRDLDGLADNIATIGLQQPLRVRSGEEGHVVIVSGHRRAAAIRKLVAEGREDLRQVPCIRETTEGSPSLRELRLIYANSSTRTMNGAEISRQAEKVQELLYRLKEEGYEFPGRMRDYVAEACKISRSKLGRLKKIETRLAPCYKPLWDAGGLPEDAADALSSLPKDAQERIKRVCPKKTPAADAIRRMGTRLEEGNGYVTTAFRCPDGGACDHFDRFFRHDLTCDSWATCRGAECCAKCKAGGAHDPRGFSGAACPEMCAKARALYEKAKVGNAETAKREAAARRSAAVKRGMADAARFVRAADAAGVPDDEEVPGYCGSRTIARLRAIASGDVPDSETNYALETVVPYTRNELIKAADVLQCSTDFLLGRTDRLRPDEAEPGQTVLAAWMPGTLTPPEPCEAVADFSLGRDVKSRPMRMTCRWDGEAWRFRGGGESIDLDVIRWLRLPDVEEDADDQG